MYREVYIWTMILRSAVRPIAFIRIKS